ncbi:MAG: galactose mutarotase [Treponema sp.]|nr:galactose mutarotase [Treponema sp.]
MPGIKVSKSKFGTLYSGKRIHIFTVSNGSMSFSVTDLGCTVTSIVLSGKNLHETDVLLGHSTLDGYVNSKSCFGSLVGRFANRISGGSYTYGGKKVSLDVNDEGKNCLHGGFDRYEKKVWDYRIIKKKNCAGIEFTRLSPDGEQGFPGDVMFRVSYTLTGNNEITLDYTAFPSKSTPVNLTNHACFNLSGSGTVKNHELKLECSSFLETDASLCPTGKINKVSDNSVYDFTKVKSVGKDIDKVGAGYDTPFVIDGWDGSLKKCAVLSEPVSGRTLTVLTTLPAVQVYTGNYLEGVMGKNGRVYKNHDGICLETEGFPDAPNHGNFPDCIYSPERVYHEKTVWQFSF